ncbi:arylsulfatase A-like enzyme [Dyadobacter jejuensis]|uniref:Arylsulfatase A-like enzyme n=1 Tax=Dyadobacter jejuensis TaxID=1082580 RepID=A0A316A8G2_9BACT|nr:sulfatase [Dyadobacter jejuensis]PWJ54071.1 arylsulfatase A-like enzyme [Dyadobacter jejuensis]
MIVLRCMLLLGLLSSQAVYSQKQIKPNIVMISVDDLNDFIGGMGHPDAITPNLDKLINKGVLFTNAQCQSPMCGPSRTAVMTGVRPSTSGIYGMIDDNAIKEVNAATQKSTFLQQYFKDAGYYTMGVGKIFHEHAPDGVLDESGGRVPGFGPKPKVNFHWDQKKTSTDWGAFPETDEQMPDYKSAQWAVERLHRSYDRPFFLSVGFLRPHVPWYVPQKWFDLYDKDKIHLPPYLKSDRDDLPAIALEVDDLPMMPTTDWAIETGQWKDILHGYLASVSFVDHYVGEVLNALENSPYADNTIVVLWSDHGYRLGQKGTFAKMCLWNSATAAPLIFSGPGLPHNVKIDVPVELFSIYPTLTDLCDLLQNKNLEARSLSPLLLAPNTEWEYPTITTWARNNHAICTSDYRYIHYEDGSEELYLLKTDPNEWYNEAGNKKYTKIKQRLKAFLPKVNEKWAAASEYSMNAYFIKQKEEQSN